MRVPESVRFLIIGCALNALLLTGCAGQSGRGDPLPSWSEGPAKQTISDFVVAVSDPDSSAYLPQAERVAVFDNDGTLWSEEPWPVPFEFIFFRIRQLAHEHPEWVSTQPYQAVLEEDYEWLYANFRQAIGVLSPVAQANLTAEQYDAYAAEFLARARHPETGRLYTEMVYQPMLELVTWLQQKGFSVYVVSGGDVDFIRAYSEKIYGVPKSYVIGSRVEYKVKVSVDGLELLRQPVMDTVNIGAFKVVNIHARTGRRPVFAVGNSDGDLKMMQYVDTESGLSMLLLHDDPEREFEQPLGYAQVADQAAISGWLTVSMRRDFRQVFPLREIESEVVEAE